MRAVLIVAALALFDGPVAAQDASDGPAAPAEYDLAISAAVDEFASGHWAEARALFLRAHDLFPNARALRGVGMSAFELRDYVAAADALEAARHHAVRPLTDEQRAQVDELLTRARGFVGRFLVPSAPDGARLYVDGGGVSLPPPWPDEPAPILLAVGEHMLSVRVDGRAATARVQVVGGEDRTLDIDLAPLGEPAREEHPVAGPPSREHTPTTRTELAPEPAPWVVLGVGAAVAIAGAMMLAFGVADLTSVETAPAGTPWPSVSGAFERAPILTGLGIGLLSVGLAGSAIGLGWGLTPTASEARGGLSLRGSF